jgi:hypothetical protein
MSFMKYEMHDFDLALVAYFDAMKADYVKWTKNISTFGKYDIVADKAGQKFMRIINTSSGGQRSSHSFIVLKDCQVTKTAVLYSKKPKEFLNLRAGDILKCASWKAPALNFIRGNILDGNYGACKWTGAA